MEDALISELDYVGSSGYTLNDLLVLVNYDVPEGTTKNTKLTDLKNYVLSSVSADTNTFITGFTYNENTFTIFDNSGNTFSASINVLTGLTINGDLTITGSTNIDSINTNTISATTYQNLPTDITVTGGTFDNNTDTITFRNNTGGTFNVTGITDYFVTGITYSQGTLTLNRQDGNTSTTILPDWLTSTTYKTKDLVIALYENEYRLFRALTGFTSSGVSFPGGQTIATDLNSYIGQWQEVSPLRGVMSNVSFVSKVSFSGTITPPALTGDVNNYNPSGLSTCNFIRISNSTGANVNLTGLQAPNPPSSQAIFICNVGVAQITIPNNSASSLAGNKFITGNNRVLQNDEGIMVIYDPISLCWRSQAIQV